MRDLKVTVVNISADSISINRNEAAVRLKIPRSYTDEAITKCEKSLKKSLKCKYAYIKVSVSLNENNICTLGDIQIQSKDLYKNLTDCKEAYIIGATIGIETDRLINRLQIVSPGEAFITDALASAAAETLCEYADTQLRGTNAEPMRYSPGYGDLPLTSQTDILNLLNASYTLGITLNKSLLMTPMKSVTAIMGIKELL